jgi:hypothetical protein
MRPEWGRVPKPSLVMRPDWGRVPKPSLVMRPEWGRVPKPSFMKAEPLVVVQLLCSRIHMSRKRFCLVIACSKNSPNVACWWGAGTLPAVWGNLPNLAELVLSNNSLTGKLRFFILLCFGSDSVTLAFVKQLCTA